METRHIIITGSPYSGKGTHSVEIRKAFKVCEVPLLYIGTGEIMRELKKRGFFIMSLVNESINRGELAPNWIANSVAGSLLLEKFNKEISTLWDGYPREPEQLLEFIKMMKTCRVETIEVVIIELPEEEMYRRLEIRNNAPGAKRSDDTQEAAKRRIKVYKEGVLPMIDLMEDSHMFNLHRVCGIGEIPIVSKRIFSALEFFEA